MEVLCLLNDSIREKNVFYTGTHASTHAPSGRATVAAPAMVGPALGPAAGGVRYVVRCLLFHWS